MKRRLRLLAVFCVAVLLAGCALQRLDVAVSPESGHPLSGADGLAVRFRVSGAAGEISIAFGDGETLDTEESIFVHVYRRAGDFSWEIVSGGRIATGTVTVLNNAPKVKRPFWTEGVAMLAGELVVFDPRHLLNGCDASGEPLFEWGAWDPDGDPIEIRYLCSSDETPGAEETIFSRERWDITGEWIEPDFTAWIAGWSYSWAPFPFVLPDHEDYFGDAAPLGCDPVPDPEPPLGEEHHHVTFTLEARDPWGGIGAVSWVIIVYEGCSE